MCFVEEYTTGDVTYSENRITCYHRTFELRARLLLKSFRRIPHVPHKIKGVARVSIVTQSTIALLLLFIIILRMDACVIVHGGARTITNEDEKEIFRRGAQMAARKGYEVLLEVQ